MLIWPQWIQGRSVSRLVMSVLGLVVLYFLINAPELFVPADASAAQLQALAKGINTGVHLGLVIAAIVNAVNIVVESARLIGRRLGLLHQATVS
jgi:predicted Co/Zn/Cd cation transporter (cation efflux family)